MTFNNRNRLIQATAYWLLFTLTTGVVANAADGAQAQLPGPTLADASKVKDLTFLNETGIVSISYDEPWWFEVPEYATSLSVILSHEIEAADQECTALLDELTTTDGARLGTQTRKIMNSLQVDGEFPYPRLLSSLLWKYADKSRIDPETPDQVGSYRALRGDVCSSADPGVSNIVRQMFPLPVDPDTIGGHSWAMAMCEHLDVVSSCLKSVQLTDRERADPWKTQGEESDLIISTVFSQVAPIN